MTWMMWSVEKSADPFGIAYYRNKYGLAPNQANAPLNFPESQVQALAEALQVSPEQICKTRRCTPGVIFLAHNPELLDEQNQVDQLLQNSAES
ncbi:MAG: hypothetical protein WA821_18550 [Anaerolineales bacterium]